MSDPTPPPVPGPGMPAGLQPPKPPESSGPPPMVIGGAIAIAAALVALVAVVLAGSNGDPVVAVAPTPTPEIIEEAPPSPTPEPEATAEPDVDPTPQPTAEPEGPPSVEQLARSVVQVQLLLDGQVVCSGSGTILEADGTILTNSHVIAQSSLCPHDTIGVAILDLPELPPQLLFEADLLVDEPALDLAVIRIARARDGSPITPDFPTVQIGDSDSIELGDELRVIGYPAVGGETITFTEGTVSGFVATPGVGDRSWLKTDATISAGNSGGLAVDQNGLIVGVPTIVGTGTGQIADCRVVEDTNGDGQVDQADGCIPVGGFINGIRPVNLALPLLDRARTATPIDQGPPATGAPTAPALDTIAFDPVWATALVDGVATEEAVFVRRRATQLCLTWQYRNFAPGAGFESLWFIDGVEVPEAAFSGTNQGPDEGGFFACFTNDDGIGPGLFEMVWVVEDQPIFAHGIYVGGGREEIVIDFVNGTESDLCVIQLAPSGAATFGLNHLDRPLPPGASVSVPVSTGIYDARIIDCDGIVRLEDDSGTELTQTDTATVT